MMTLAEVPWIELLEVMYINAIAPFLLTSNLQAVMKKDAGQRPSFVVNVTAMEGNFYDNKKDIRHPHTNMAKAALNMMTRTSANDLVKDRIYMNAVDPGWITNERPLLTNLLSEHGPMAIDEIDGASRICDPIFRALNDGDFSFGALFKNYKLFPW
jgi:NAD(P)-dependent dehydrogenase (short-subunit alcohol dehydrogenase family)